MASRGTCPRAPGLALPCALALACVLLVGSPAAVTIRQLPPAHVAEFANGPALVPLSAALDFLDRLAVTAPDTRVRLPVSVTFDEFRLNILDARLGRQGEASGRLLRLSDGALGIALADRARDLCPIGTRCVMKLVGHWLGSSDGVSRFDVRRVDGLAQETESQAIEVEARARR